MQQKRAHDDQRAYTIMAWSRRFIPKLFVWHSSGDIVRMKWRRFPNLLNSPLVDRSNVSTRSKLHLQPMTTRLSYLLNPFLLATALTNEISSLYINQFGSISTSFWRYPLKSVRRKALGWISYFSLINACDLHPDDHRAPGGRCTASSF